MKRHFPGLHTEPNRVDDSLEGIFLVRVERAYYRWQPQKPFFILSFVILEPNDLASRKVSGRLYCTQKSLWKLNWFLRDFGYDTDLLGRDEVDEKALLGLTGVLRTTRKTVVVLSTSKDLHHPRNGNSSLRMLAKALWREDPMTYSFTQISQYLQCPRKYRYRYLDGWREKEDRASMIFGRCFENALAAYFREEDSTATFFKEWQEHQDAVLQYAKTDSWDRLYHQGVRLLERFAQDDRVRIRCPKKDLQVKFTRSLEYGGEFVSYVDAIGELDGAKCIIDCKTTGSRYPEQPDGLLSLDPQLVCYSWMTGIADVSLVVFIRKSASEIQYLKTSIDEEQRREFGQLVETAVEQIEAGRFLPHSGIRFPQNGCVGCSHLGLCLRDQQLRDSKLIRRPGATDLDWLDQFDD